MTPVNTKTDENHEKREGLEKGGKEHEVRKRELSRAEEKG